MSRVLYHGTHKKRLDSILSKGLLPHSQIESVEKNWTCSENGVHFSISRSRARVETTSVGTPIENAVVIEVKFDWAEVKPHLGPSQEYTLNSGDLESTAWLYPGRVPPDRFVAISFYEDWGEFNRQPAT